MSRGVTLDVIEIDAYRRKGALDTHATGITLPALVELACMGVASPEMRRQGERWFSGNGVWRDAIDWLVDGVRPAAPDTWETPLVEVWGIGHADDVSGTDWEHYQQRFRRSLGASGFARELAMALSEALWEMADNVFQHSGARGVAAFHVGERWASWAVGDLGRGVLESLTTNPKWEHLTTSREALVAVYRDHATRRTDVDEGNGFRQAERSLANLNGRLRFRTGDGILTLEGARDGSSPISSEGLNPQLAGVQLSATCALGERPRRPPVTC